MLQRPLGQARQLVEATLKAEERSIAYTRGSCEQLIRNGAHQSSELIQHTWITALRARTSHSGSSRDDVSRVLALERGIPSASKPMRVPRPFHCTRFKLSATGKAIATLSIIMTRPRDRRSHASHAQ